MELNSFDSPLHSLVMDLNSFDSPLHSLGTELNSFDSLLRTLGTELHSFDSPPVQLKTGQEMWDFQDCALTDHPSFRMLCPFRGQPPKIIILQPAWKIHESPHNGRLVLYGWLGLHRSWLDIEHSNY